MILCLSISKFSLSHVSASTSANETLRNDAQQPPATAPTARAWWNHYRGESELRVKYAVVSHMSSVSHSISTPWSTLCDQSFKL